MASHIFDNFSDLVLHFVPRKLFFFSVALFHLKNDIKTFLTLLQKCLLHVSTALKYQLNLFFCLVCYRVQSFCNYRIQSKQRRGIENENNSLSSFSLIEESIWLFLLYSFVVIVRVFLDDSLFSVQG